LQSDCCNWWRSYIIVSPPPLPPFPVAGSRKEWEGVGTKSLTVLDARPISTIPITVTHGKKDQQHYKPDDPNRDAIYFI
jgi:hypothetical protein